MNKFISLIACFFGLAHACHAGTVTANFTSASTVPVTAASYSASGNDVSLSLGFAPPVGTNLTVVNNTGIGFIVGQFSNLAQGQMVDLSYGGKSYRFVTNYYGGTGNDLVLQWAYQNLAAWGDSESGQLGNNSTTSSSVPVLVTQSGVLAGKTVVSVSAGPSHSLALCSDGTVTAWGRNASGQLGNNSTTSSSVPVLVTQSGVLAGKTVVSVAAGNDYSLALCSDGTVAAWGNNGAGQLGNGGGGVSRVPVLVTQSGVLAGKTVVSVSAGISHSLALCSDGTVTAWGVNFHGELGNNSTTNGRVPVLVTQSGVLAGKTVVSVSAGSSQSLALCSDGTVTAWGGNFYGELGNNSTTNSSVPVLVTQSGVLAGKTVVSVSAGDYQSLALCSDGTVSAWGDNVYGQLGNNSTTRSTVPALVTQSGVLAGKTVVSVAAGYEYSLALCSDGTVSAWGSNGYGKLGNNSTIPSSVPVLVTQSGVLAGKTVVSVSAGISHSLAIGSIPNSPDLFGLTLSSGTLNPPFDAATTSYSASVLYAKSSITVTPTTAVNMAAVSINGSPVSSGLASQSIPLVVGDNAITITVTAPDGVTTKTYNVTVTRLPASSVSTLSGLVPSSGALSPVFAPATTSYTVSATNSTTSITVRPWVMDETATVKVNGATVTSGANSAAIPLAVGAKTITTVVTAEDGTINTYTITVTRAPSSVSTLSGLVPGSGSLSPAFASGVTSYTTAATNATTSITVRPTVTDTTATIKVNGTTVTSGSNSQSIPLTVGANTITVLVTAQDHITTRTYTLTVSRAPSSISTLSNLIPNSGSLSPVFASGTKTYLVSVNTTTWAVTPTVTDLTATLTVNGTPVVSGSASAQIPLSIGSNTITIVVTAQDGVTQTTYTITVTRLSTVSTLSGLVLDSGPVSPTFAPGTLAYSALVGNSTTSVKVTPTSTESYASVTVNGSTVASGSTSNTIPLVVGPNTIHVIATAQDGSSTTYTLTVTREFMDITFIEAGTTALSASSYDTTGNAVNLTLAFAPSTGTNLTLVDNTGLGFIVGRFSNLAQGQTVNLTYQDITYRFVANYYGVSGNDLVLQWAENKTYAWGANSRGQLGDNTASNSSLPVAVMHSGILSGKTILAISTGSSHSLALCSDGTIAAWGYNFHGQLGDGGTTDSNVPVAVVKSGVLAGKTVVAVSAGFFHSLALCSDGSVAAWGYNLYGQLGNNSTVSSSLPVLVSSTGALSGKVITSIAAGYHHNTALCSEGTVVSWGRNNYGQLGNNNVSDSTVPVNITTVGSLNGRTVATLAAGSDHSLALCSDGTLLSWGRNTNGQLGDGSNTDRSIPVEVDATDALAGRVVTKISAGGFHNLAACTDGTLVAFGRNTNGQLGNNSTADTNAPVIVTLSPVLSGKTVIALQGANAHSLALCSDGTLASWGASSNGQLGNGNIANSNVPVAVTTSNLGNGEKVITLPSGCSASHSMALAAVPLSADSRLTSLVLSSGSLSPAFSADITSYAVDVPVEVSSIQITPVKANTYATIRVNGITVASGADSAPILLSVGANPITLTITAQNGSTTITTVIVTRAVGTYASWLDNVFTPEELADSAISGEQASPAGDGITNLMKYALALDPKVCGTGGMPIAADRDGYLTLTYRKNKLATDLTYTVQVGAELSATEWSEATTVVSQTDEGNYWLVTVRDNVTQTGHPTRFMRLRVQK
jgi:alpha-tubulin suppressor-like RCC1 family protein